ncbi:hypothetical protein BKA70DRAFT_1435783 [Coprinopsis sp. MPI-PUGE-AT-0042]|nr:hypothetical protein BKA70DRAFT_1435783 [Coprinopsis sp. MPI-PUGE-AT-0042]
MAQRRQGKRGTVRNRNVIQGSNGLTINGGTYSNGNAPTTIQYNLLVINLNSSPSLRITLHSVNASAEHIKFIALRTNDEDDITTIGRGHHNR